MQYRLKSLKTFPPGGWQFKQRETHWGLPPGLSFGQAVAKIIDHRRANKLDANFKASLDATKVAKELEEFTIVRIGFDSGFVYSPDEKKKFHSPATGNGIVGQKLKAKGCPTCGKAKK